MKMLLMTLVAALGLGFAVQDAQARHFYGGWGGGGYGWGGGYRSGYGWGGYRGWGGGWGGYGYGVGYRGWGGYGLGYRSWGYPSYSIGYGGYGYGYPYGLGYSSYGYSGYPYSGGYWSSPIGYGSSSYGYSPYSYGGGYASYSSYPAATYSNYTYAPTYQVSYPTSGYSWSGSYGAVLPSYGSGYRTCGSCGLEYSSVGTPVYGNGTTTALYPQSDVSGQQVIYPASGVSTSYDPCTCQ